MLSYVVKFYAKRLINSAMFKNVTSAPKVTKRIVVDLEFTNLPITFLLDVR